MPMQLTQQPWDKLASAIRNDIRREHAADVVSRARGHRESLASFPSVLDESQEIDSEQFAAAFIAMDGALADVIGQAKIAHRDALKNVLDEWLEGQE